MTGIFCCTVASVTKSLTLQEVQQYGRSDSFSDPDYIRLYGLTPTQWYGRGVRLLGRTAVEWPKPAYTTHWPLDERGPELTQYDLPLKLPSILHNFDARGP
jgi:hypothetical protein